MAKEDVTRGIGEAVDSAGAALSGLAKADEDRRALANEIGEYLHQKHLFGDKEWFGDWEDFTLNQVNYDEGHTVTVTKGGKKYKLRAGEKFADWKRNGKPVPGAPAPAPPAAPKSNPADDFKSIFGGIADAAKELSGEMEQNSALQTILNSWAKEQGINTEGLSVRHFNRDGNIEFKLKTHSVSQGLDVDHLYYASRNDLMNWAKNNRPELIPGSGPAPAPTSAPASTAAPVTQAVDFNDPSTWKAVGPDKVDVGRPLPVSEAQATTLRYGKYKDAAHKASETVDASGNRVRNQTLANVESEMSSFHTSSASNLGYEGRARAKPGFRKNYEDVMSNIYKDVSEGVDPMTALRSHINNYDIPDDIRETIVKRVQEAELNAGKTGILTTTPYRQLTEDEYASRLDDTRRAVPAPTTTTPAPSPSPVASSATEEVSSVPRIVMKDTDELLYEDYQKKTSKLKGSKKENPKKINKIKQQLAKEHGYDVEDIDEIINREEARAKAAADELLDTTDNVIDTVDEPPARPTAPPDPEPTSRIRGTLAGETPPAPPTAPVADDLIEPDIVKKIENPTADEYADARARGDLIATETYDHGAEVAKATTTGEPLVEAPPPKPKRTGPAGVSKPTAVRTSPVPKGTDAAAPAPTGTSVTPKTPIAAVTTDAPKVKPVVPKSSGAPSKGKSLLDNAAETARNIAKGHGNARTLGIVGAASLLGIGYASTRSKKSVQRDQGTYMDESRRDLGY